jgi:alkylation response protein AidB-like acyl-CoA dehydrogenase
MAIAPPTPAQSDEEEMILDVVRDLVRDKVEPRAAEIDATGEFPWDIQKLFAQNDLLGIPFPAEYGGLGGTFRTYVRVVEEVAKACASSALIIAVQELGALPILIGGTDEQKRRFIPKLASGEWVAAYALTEAGSMRPARCARARAATATPTCSTARRSGSPRAASPISPPSSR